jgi:hypothetical protein
MCGREFWGSPLRRYCAPPCQRRATAARHSEKSLKTRPPSYYNYEDKE